MNTEKSEAIGGGLSRHRLRVSSAELCVGMYVEAVDRPWAETPFAFQGFYLHSPDDVAYVREHCEFAYVTVTKVLRREINKSCLSRPSLRQSQFDGRNGGQIHLEDDWLQWLKT